MAYETQSTDTEKKIPLSLGNRLKNAREELGLERKDVAAQLRLNEKIIVMMEKDRYPIDLPVTFIRGYIRSYGKFLQVPEFELKEAIDRIKIKSIPSSNAPTLKPYKIDTDSQGNFIVQLFTGLIIVTIIGLVGVWYYTHYVTPVMTLPELSSASENQSIAQSPSLTNPVNYEMSSTASTRPLPIPKMQKSDDLAKSAQTPQNTSSNNKSSDSAYSIALKPSTDKLSGNQKFAPQPQTEVTGLYAD